MAPPVVVPDEGQAVSGLFRDYLAGSGYRELAARLNAQGFVPRSKRGRAVFGTSSVQSIIENDFYAGFVRHGESRKRGLHEAVISEDLWLAAQARPERRTVQARMPRFLTGILGCYQCGGPVWVTKSGRSGAVPYYREAARARAMPCPAAGRVWRCSEAEGQLTQAIESMASDADWLARVDRAARMPMDEGAALERARLLEAKRRVSEVYMAGAIDRGEWQQRQHAIELQLANLPAGDGGLAHVVAPRIERIGQVWAVMGVEERREATQALFEWVRLDWQAREVRLQPWPEFRAAFEHRRESGELVA